MGGLGATLDQRHGTDDPREQQHAHQVEGEQQLAEERVADPPADPPCRCSDTTAGSGAGRPSQKATTAMAAAATTAAA